MAKKVAAFISILFVLYTFGCSSDDSEDMPGNLDKTFNYPDGFVVFNSGADADDAGVEVAVQNDGKIVVMGSSNNGDNDDILVMRLFENGMFDSSFGTGGFITYNALGDDKDRG